MKYICCVLLSFLYIHTASAQFEPAAGHIGSTAVYQDSTVIMQWAKSCKLQRGYMNIANPSSGYASVGDENAPIGKAGTNGVASLGDGGSAVLTFDLPVANGEGFDFAVFENGFEEVGDTLDFLEYAFVEVSSDGIQYVRFPSRYVGDTSNQVTSFQATNTRLYHNLAGKYTAGFGTPFDLEELKNEPGLDVDHVTHVKIVDVVGSMTLAYATRDQEGRKVNDPWPTEFSSSGFDLDAVGVIHLGAPLGISSNTFPFETKIYPNPATEALHIVSYAEQVKVEMKNLIGKTVLENEFAFSRTLDVSAFSPGIYMLDITANTLKFSKKVLIQ